MEDISPDHSTISRFRTAMTQANVYEKLFSAINKQLEQHAIIVKTGVLVDASVIDTPLKPKGRKRIDIGEQSLEKKHEKLFLSCLGLP